jgi:hypothetical protein
MDITVIKLADQAEIGKIFLSEGCYAICPSCGKIAEVTYENYTSNPVAICWADEECCGGYFFLEASEEDFQVTVDEGEKHTIETKVMKILSVSNGHSEEDSEEHPDEKYFVPCNSYNMNQPSSPYPPDFKLDHDGVYLYIKALDSQGKIREIILSGD